MQNTCMLHRKTVPFRLYITWMNILQIKHRTREEGNAVSVCGNIINYMFTFAIFGKDVKFIQPFTENVITTIKLSDTDNVVVVGTDVNLLILLSKLSHPITMFSCANLQLVTFIVKYTIQSSQRLQHQFLNQYLTISVFYVILHENILIVLQTVSMYITPITTYSASYIEYSIELATVGTVNNIVWRWCMFIIYS